MALKLQQANASVIGRCTLEILAIGSSGPNDRSLIVL